MSLTEIRESYLEANRCHSQAKELAKQEFIEYHCSRYPVVFVLVCRYESRGKYSSFTHRAGYYSSFDKAKAEEKNFANLSNHSFAGCYIEAISAAEMSDDQWLKLDEPSRGY